MSTHCPVDAVCGKDLEPEVRDYPLTDNLIQYDHEPLFLTRARTRSFVNVTDLPLTRRDWHL